MPGGPAKTRPKRSLLMRIEAFVSRLSTRNMFWHRVCSLIWLPYAFRSGITMRRLDDNSFQAVLPFRRFNRNWYNAMAGAALLGNAEIAGGSYVFGRVGAEYTVVCKKLEYTFLRPCFGPAIYRITPKESVEELMATGEEFNITVDMAIVQAITADKVKPGSPAKDKRVGRATAVFHVTPKAHLRARGRMGLMSNQDPRQKTASALPQTVGNQPENGQPSSDQLAEASSPTESAASKPGVV